VHLLPDDLRFLERSLASLCRGEDTRSARGASQWLLHCAERLVMRHTKDQQISGADALELPPCVSSQVLVRLPPEQQEAYDALYGVVLGRLQRLIRNLDAEAIKKYTVRLQSLLYPLRQACSCRGINKDWVEALQDAKYDTYPLNATVSDSACMLLSRDVPLSLAPLPAAARGLTKDQQALYDKAVEEIEREFKRDMEDYVLKLAAKPDEESCTICMELPESKIMTPCKHIFCLPCIINYSKANQQGFGRNTVACPLCRTTVNVKTDLKEVPPPAPPSEPPPKRRALPLSLLDAFGSGDDDIIDGSQDEQTEPPPPPPVRMVAMTAKLDALLADLSNMLRVDPAAKALVFSSFSETTDAIANRLFASNIRYLRLDGSIDGVKRGKVVSDFSDDDRFKVLVMSMRACNSGLNLTRASHVYIMEPTLNSAQVQQAVYRVWRIGQRRTTLVKHMIVAGSVEERLFELTEKRTRMEANMRQGENAAGDEMMTTVAAHDMLRVLQG
jgi:SNF2 family DNA or RNA helicase